jgi:hypothetical protein
MDIQAIYSTGRADVAPNIDQFHPHIFKITFGIGVTGAERRM